MEVSLNALVFRFWTSSFGGSLSRNVHFLNFIFQVSNETHVSSLEFCFGGSLAQDALLQVCFEEVSQGALTLASLASSTSHFEAEVAGSIFDRDPSSHDSLSSRRVWLQGSCTKSSHKRIWLLGLSQECLSCFSYKGLSQNVSPRSVWQRFSEECLTKMPWRSVFHNLSRTSGGLSQKHLALSYKSVRTCL